MRRSSARTLQITRTTSKKGDLKHSLCDCKYFLSGGEAAFDEDKTCFIVVDSDGFQTLVGSVLLCSHRLGLKRYTVNVRVLLWALEINKLLQVSHILLIFYTSVRSYLFCD